MKTKDLIIVGLLFGLIVNFGSNLYKDHKIYKLEKEVIDTKKEYIKLYYEDRDYINILEDSRESLNDALDDKDKEIQEYKYLEKLLKDLSRHTN